METIDWKLIEGTMLNIKKQYFRTSIMENCTVNVIARPYIPFVINDSYGFEIEILRSIGHMSNINFNITISNDMVDSWGCKINDSWTGNLNLVYDEMYLGIGNIDIGMGNSTDFDFSQFYHIEPLIYVVPAAELVPKWRILTVIFTIEMWGICIVTMIIFSLTFCCSSLFFKKQAETTRMQSPFLSSFQVLIGQVVDQQPVQDVQRVFFISLSIFSIIISSLYTSSLIYYLKNPIKQHQISDPEELFDIFGNIQYEVGGLLKYRMFYNLTNSPKLLKLLDVYQSISEGNETVEYWLQMVSIRNDFWTISSDFFVKYLLAIGSNSTTNPDGQPKVTPLNKPLLSYPVGIIMRRGHPLLERINSSIKQLLYGGFVSHFCRQYLNKIGEDNIIDNLKNTAIFQALSLEHLQGAFAVLTSGYITGGVTLITECIFDILMSKRNWPN
ncbi:hypothetical protein JTB14_000532 [Gonioctena quinquepunctata]|nr:hypothetical protein JTB14_000532 [Gonioctena quinquepunctata]